MTAPPQPNIDLERTVFDVLIVGSGFGGGTTAYALSRAGLKVLLVERGGWPARDETDWNGRAILLDGRYKGETPVDVRQLGARTDVETFPNEVVGGNSIFFGGAALRLRATTARLFGSAFASAVCVTSFLAPIRQGKPSQVKQLMQRGSRAPAWLIAIGMWNGCSPSARAASAIRRAGAVRSAGGNG